MAAISWSLIPSVMKWEKPPPPSGTPTAAYRQLAEALAEYWHARTRAALGISGADPADLDTILRVGYQDCRYSFGYPACPNLAYQRPLLELLGAERIAISMSEADELEPEQSTSAIVILHPQAQYITS